MTKRHTTPETPATPALRDADNPTFALQTLSVTLLAQAARGEIDLNRIAREELASRGLDWQGKWVGFEKAARLGKCFPVIRDGKTIAVSVPE